MNYRIQVFESFDEFYSRMAALNSGKPYQPYFRRALADTKGARAKMTAGYCRKWESRDDFENKRDFSEKMKSLRWNKKSLRSYVWAAAGDSFNQIGSIHQ